MLFHITTAAAWAAARRSGTLVPASLAGEGFVHLSTAHQVCRVAAARFATTPGLVLLALDEGALASPLRYEPAADAPGGRFPHLYGPLPVAAVLLALPWHPGPDGTFSLPADLATG